ncbi:DUF305 domain-containing protein [Sanguibacter sp. 25GB23B1]|uniref:DUF305 domain-containing protein n=1 Tax=unclassified Sanguibacter TaxID=2645534 RepID=UPI0032B01F4D
MKMYARLGIAMVLSLTVMFFLSFTQTRTWDHVHLNLSNFYISLTMIGSMGLIMLLVMWPMYENKRLNLGLLGIFVLVLVGGFALARTETFVGDREFLSSMIPHHSRAILVCQEADLSDPEIIELCEQIISTQRDEITQMEEIIDRLEDAD